MQIKLLGQFCRWLWTVFWERGFFWNTSANSKSKAVPFHHKSFIYIFFLLLTFTLLFSFFETSFAVNFKIWNSMMETQWVRWPLMKVRLGNMCSLSNIFVDYLCDSIKILYTSHLCFPIFKIDRFCRTSANGCF